MERLTNGNFRSTHNAVRRLSIRHDVVLFELIAEYVLFIIAISMFNRMMVDVQMYPANTM
jgi:hypothetical protein